MARRRREQPDGRSLAAHPTGEHPFVDGHASCILKAYREALNHPDDSFFKEYWPHVKRAVEYLIDRDAAGGTPDGILEDDQFNTYDQALHGVTTFMSGYYLAALRAGEQWAKRMGDAETAQRFHAIFLKGQENLVKRCWNGEYFQQDLPDYGKQDAGGEVGPGCMADQLIGQWWAHQLGLGYILPKDKVQTALRSIFKYNWLTGLAGFKQSPRTFVGDEDKGLLICTWPKGGRPKTVMLYSDEVWTGTEYQVAGHMIYEGMIEEAYAIVKGGRDRYDGIPRPPIGRNPWNEIECGGHYARAMSSWSLLLALSGYEYDGVAKTLRFMPRTTPTNFKAFFSGPEGWGSLRQLQEGATQRNEIQVVEGRLAVAQLHLAPPAGVQQVKVTLGNAPVEAALQHEPTGGAGDLGRCDGHQSRRHVGRQPFVIGSLHVASLRWNSQGYRTCSGRYSRAPVLRLAQEDRLRKRKAVHQVAFVAAGLAVPVEEFGPERIAVHNSVLKTAAVGKHAPRLPLEHRPQDAICLVILAEDIVPPRGNGSCCIPGIRR